MIFIPPAKIVEHFLSYLSYYLKSLLYLCFQKLSDSRGMTNTDTISYDHVVLKPSEQIGLHRQSSWELSYIITGRGSRILGDSEEDFTKGEVVLVVPGMPHQWIFDPNETDKNGNIENITVTFAPDLLGGMAEIVPEYSALANWYSGLDTSIKFAKGESEYIRASLVRMADESPEERINTLLGLLIKISRSSNFVIAGRFPTPVSIEDRMKKAKIYISCNYQRNICIDDIAQYMGMNRSSLCIAFKQATGQTIFGCLTQLRLKAACHLLENDNNSVAECCYKSGFNDVPHFNRVFKKNTGMSPSEYRKRVK